MRGRANAQVGAITQGCGGKSGLNKFKETSARKSKFSVCDNSDLPLLADVDVARYRARVQGHPLSCNGATVCAFDLRYVTRALLPRVVQRSSAHVKITHVTMRKLWLGIFPVRRGAVVARRLCQR